MQLDSDNRSHDAGKLPVSRTLAAAMFVLMLLFVWSFTVSSGASLVQAQPGGPVDESGPAMQSDGGTATATLMVTESPDARRATRTPTPTPTGTPQPTPGAGVLAKVIKIVDGDTIDVSIGGKKERVRYIGMDTPEKNEHCFRQATAANSKLVKGKTVLLVKDVSERDQYERLLRYVYVGSTLVNGELVRNGWAVAKRYPPDVAMAEYLSYLQSIATGGCSLLPTPKPTKTPRPTATTPSSKRGVVITSIFFNPDGTMESGEYVEIRNFSTKKVALKGWKLTDRGKYNTFAFPNYTMAPNEVCRVYTNENHPEYCAFNFGDAEDNAIWNNGGDTATLTNNRGKVVSTCGYTGEGTHIDCP